MTPQISTDPSQSKRLLDCGVNPETSDMTWVTLKSPCIEGKTDVLMAERLLKFDNPPKMPSWSLSALLALLPSPLYEENRKQWSLQITPTPHSEAWVIAYADSHTSLYQTNGATLVEAAVRMMETLVKNRIKLNNQ